MRAFRSWLLLPALALLTTTGCILAPVMPDHVSGGHDQASASAPKINSLTYNPASGGVNDTYTFTLVASDPQGLPLQYSWSSTKGTLSATSGLNVSWRPIKADGSPDTGLATISVLVSDGAQVTSGSVNIQIAANGSVASSTATPSPTPVPSASPSTAASPTAAPTASPSASPTATPTASGTAKPASDTVKS